jgi:hypothetical protein
MSVVRVYQATNVVIPITTLYGDGNPHEVILRLIDGWLDTTESVVKLAERAASNGAHDVPESDLLYGPRTIAIDYRLLADSRSRLLQLHSRFRILAGKQLLIRVTDDDSDLFAQGYLHELAVDKAAQNLAQQTETGTLTFVCPRPELLSWTLHRVQLFGARVKPGGLSFGDDHKGLVFPLQFTEHGDDGGADSITNDGSFEAYPLISVTGNFSSGILIQHDQGALEWSGNIGGSPLILDCSPRAHTATMGGVDVSRNLKRRDFPIIPAAGSISLRVMSAGSGWVTVESRDTYM